ncbi:MAG: hypothetical protein ACHQ4J_04785 [Candidatus Binatia bacterium]
MEFMEPTWRVLACACSLLAAGGYACFGSPREQTHQRVADPVDASFHRKPSGSYPLLYHVPGDRLLRITEAESGYAA